MFAPDAFIQSKTQRETDAMLQIEKEFPDFPDLHETIREYELGESEESKFIYSLDKIIPIINLYLEGNGFWRKKGVTYKQLFDNKEPKVAKWPNLVPLFNEIMDELAKHPEYFA